MKPLRFLRKEKSICRILKRFFCFYFSSTWTANAQEGTLYGNLDIQGTILLFHSTFSRHGIDRASSSMLIWFNENVPFYGTFSRHGIARASSSLLIWLNETVPFHGTFSRHGITRASSVLLIWLNENVVLKSFFSQPHSINSHKKPSCSP